MLGTKKANTNEQWLKAFDIADKLITKGQAEELVGDAAERLKRATADRTAVCCWSGGKDAQVVRLICEKAGITAFAMGNGGVLEYPAFQAWVRENMPIGLKTYTADVNFEVFNRMPNLVFPTNGADSYWYYKNINQQGWRRAAEDTAVDFLILGHRHWDGNQKGRPWRVNGRTVEKLFPIWDFTHEEVLAIIKHFSLPMAPIYWWRDGFIEGTHIPIARSGKHGMQYAVDAINEIDDTIIPQLAQRIDKIRHFIERGD